MRDPTLVFKPTRGDDVENWLKRKRDGVTGEYEWEALDTLLDDYRLHADTGTPLTEEVQGG